MIEKLSTNHPEGVLLSSFEEKINEIVDAVNKFEINRIKVGMHEIGEDIVKDVRIKKQEEEIKFLEENICKQHFTISQLKADLRFQQDLRAFQCQPHVHTLTEHGSNQFICIKCGDIFNKAN